MDESEIVSSTDFSILSLRNQVAARDAEIKELNHRLETMEYYFTIHRESIRKIMDRDTEAMKRARYGDIEKPVLREIKDEGRMGGNQA